LKSLSAARSPTEKLTCLVETGKLICVSVSDFWRQRKDPSELVMCAANFSAEATTRDVLTANLRGADDLMPIYCYVVIKANVPHLYTESMIMQDFMSDKAAMEVPPTPPSPPPAA
jgi:hypothetical protein